MSFYEKPHKTKTSESFKKKKQQPQIKVYSRLCKLLRKDVEIKIQTNSRNSDYFCLFSPEETYTWGPGACIFCCVLVYIQGGHTVRRND